MFGSCCYEFQQYFRGKLFIEISNSRFSHILRRHKPALQVSFILSGEVGDISECTYVKFGRQGPSRDDLCPDRLVHCLTAVTSARIQVLGRGVEKPIANARIKKTIFGNSSPWNTLPHQGAQ